LNIAQRNIMLHNNAPKAGTIHNTHTPKRRRCKGQGNRVKQHQGFTLIELVVVVTIVAILSVFAFPRFAKLSDHAHRASVRATAGALAAGITLTKAQWLANGLTAAAENIQGFGNDNVEVSEDGWPVATSGPADTTMTVVRCREVWAGVLQSNAPTIMGPEADYKVTVSAGNCVFTYQLDGLGSNTMYNAGNGEVLTAIYR